MRDGPGLYAWRLAALLCVGLVAAGCGGGLSAEREAYETRSNAFELLEEGRRLEANGMPRLALVRYNRSVLLSETPEAWFRMGRIFEREGKHREAAAAYLRAWRLAPDLQEAKLAILALGFRLPDQPPTEDELEAAMAWAEQQRAAETAARGDDATTATQPVEPDPVGEQLALAAERRRPTAAEVRGVLFAPHAPEDAPAEADASAEVDSATYIGAMDIVLGTYPYHLRKGRQLARRRQLAKAVEEFQRAIEADPEQIEAWLEIADALFKLERHPKARRYLEQALRDFPDNPQPYLKLGDYFLELSQHPRAQEFYRAALEISPTLPAAFNNLAVLAMREEDYSEAKELLRQLLRVDPENAQGYYNLAVIARDIDKDFEAAERYLVRYLELEGERSATARRLLQELREERP